MADNKKISEMFEESLTSLNRGIEYVNRKLEAIAGGGGLTPNSVYTLTGVVTIEAYKEGKDIRSYWLGLQTKEGTTISLRSFLGPTNTAKFVNTAVNEWTTKEKYTMDDKSEPFEEVISEESETSLKTTYTPFKLKTRVIAQIADAIQSKEWNLENARVKYLGKAVTQSISKTKYNFGETYVLPGFKRAVTYQCWEILSKPNDIAPKQDDSQSN